MNFDIVEVLVRAWKITWKYKVLWIFGMLASCGRGSGGNGSGGNNYRSTGNPYAPGGQFPNEMFDQMIEFMDRVFTWFTENPWAIVALVVFGLALWLIQIILSTVGGIGLIRGAYHAETGMEKIVFTDLFRESLRYFWRTIGLGLVIWLPVLVIFLGTMFTLILSTASSSTTADGVFGAFFVLFFIGLCCCFLPILIVLGIYYTQALRALVLEDLGIFASLSRGWDVFRRNIGGLLIVAVILFIINLIIGLALAIPVFIAIIPLMNGFMGGTIDSWQPFILTGILVLLYSPIAWFLGGILLAYIETIWTLTYMRVARHGEAVPVSVEPNA
jgi:hypothetical protein